MERTRDCDQCGTAFVPRREHARFCSASCRIAWNAEHASAVPPGAAPLDWSIAAMTEAVERLAGRAALELPRAVTAVSEATWWVTIVDATLVRYHPCIYDAALASQPPGDRKDTEERLAGLRYVRNQMGRLDQAAFIRSAGHRASGGHGTAWVWNPLPAPVRGSLSRHGHEWEMARYRAYQARLADRDVAETFTVVNSFLVRTARQAAPVAPASGHAAR